KVRSDSTIFQKTDEMTRRSGAGMTRTLHHTAGHSCARVCKLPTPVTRFPVSFSLTTVVADLKVLPGGSPMAKASSISAANVAKFTQAAVRAATKDVPGKVVSRGPIMGYILA